MVNIQVFPARQAYSFPVYAPQFFQHIPGQALRVLDDRVVMMATTNFPVLRDRGVLRRRHPLGALHSVPVTPPVKPLDVVRKIQVGPVCVPRLRQMIVVVCPSPGEIPFSEVGVDELHMVSLGPFVVVGLLCQRGCFFFLCPA